MATSDVLSFYDLLLRIPYHWRDDPTDPPRTWMPSKYSRVRRGSLMLSVPTAVQSSGRSNPKEHVVATSHPRSEGHESVLDSATSKKKKQQVNRYNT